MNKILRWIRLKLIPPRFRLAATYYYLRFSGALENEICIVKDLIKARGTAIDVGANEGAWSYPLSRIFSKVEAFEPIPDCAAIIKDSGNKNIEVHQVALSSSKGIKELHIPIANGKPLTGYATFGDLEGEYTTMSIPVHKLDDYSFTGVAFMKIDVEGHELEVIKGAEATIRREKPAMIVEIEQRHLNFPMALIFDAIIKFGYKAFFLQGNQLHPLSEFSYEEHQGKFLDVPFSRDYIHNFLFMPD